MSPNKNNNTRNFTNRKSYQQQMMQSPLCDEASVWYIPSVHPKTTEAYVKDVFENRSKIGLVDHVDIVVDELIPSKCSMFVHITCWYRGKFSDQFRRNVANRVQGYNRLRHGGNKRNWFWVCFPSTSEGKKEEVDVSVTNVDTNNTLTATPATTITTATDVENDSADKLTVENLQQWQILVDEMDKPMQLSDLIVGNSKTDMLKNILGIRCSTPEAKVVDISKPPMAPLRENKNVSDTLAPIVPIPENKPKRKIYDWAEDVDSDDEEEDNMILSSPKSIREIQSTTGSAFEKPKLKRQQTTYWNLNTGSLAPSEAWST